MKARVFLILAFAVVLIGSAWIKVAGSEEDKSDFKSSVVALEEKLSLVYSEQKKENDSYRLELEELRSEIKALKNNKESTTVAETVVTPVEKKGFTYEVNEDKATITGYLGKDTYIVIPTHIDGYEVHAIGESAFAYSKVTTVIISEGVKEIDWFAFYACPSLTSVTLPRSIDSIGYAAFDGASSNFTVYCYSGSYAYNFAKSYGLSYLAA